jgi:hypothetical protein
MVGPLSFVAGLARACTGFEMISRQNFDARRDEQHCNTIYTSHACHFTMSSFLRRNNGGGGGLARPSLDSMKTTRRPNAAKAATPPPPAAQTDDEYDGYDDSEAEEEALLSKRHGEAAEDNSGNKKRSANDMTDGNSDAKISAEYKKKARRKAPTTVKPEDLLRPHGLVAVRRGFAEKFHSSAAGKKYPKTVAGMAKYSRHLVAAYRNWMDTLTGGIPLEEGMWKLATLQSKTNVKQYLQEMRNSVRNEHVERTVGLEMAENLLSQLEDYQLQQQQQYQDEDQGDDDENQNGEDEEKQDENEVVNNPYTRRQAAAPKDDQDVADAATEGDDAVTQSTIATRSTIHNENDKDVAAEASNSPVVAASQRPRSRHVLEDSDDEDEAMFDDVQAGAVVEPSPEKEQEIPVSVKANRLVLDDDESDDDDGEDEKAVSQGVTGEEDEKDEDAIEKEGNSASPSNDHEDPPSEDDAACGEKDAHDVDTLSATEGKNVEMKDDEAAELLDADREENEEASFEASTTEMASTSKEKQDVGSPIEPSVPKPAFAQKDAQDEETMNDDSPELSQADEECGEGKKEAPTFKRLPLAQASQDTLMGTQLSQADSIFDDSQPRVWPRPAVLRRQHSSSSSMDDAGLSQESETPTVLGTQGMTQEWTSQQDEGM